MLLNMRGGWAGDPGDQRMPSALELWIFPDELDPIYAESLGLMADQIARSRLVIRKNEERLERPSAVHQVFAIDEVELHSDLRQKRPALSRRPEVTLCIEARRAAHCSLHGQRLRALSFPLSECGSRFPIWRDRAGLSVRLPTACPLHYSGTTEPFGIRTLLFIYYIVPAGGGEEDALVRGKLWTATVETAKNYLPGVTAPNVKDRSGLEVILLDQQGNEIFRCRHKAGPP